MRFCPKCGHQVTMEIPSGDNRERAVCHNCDFIDYDNPRLITGTLPIYDGKILLCKRNIEPRLGFWTLPAGFMENGETTAEGALRETLEETGATAVTTAPYCLISIPRINQVHLFYLASLPQPNFHATEESSEVALFELKDIPWDEIAFSSVAKALAYYVEDSKTGHFPFHEDLITFNSVGK